MHSYTDFAQQAVQDIRNGNAELLDVRRADEWGFGHASGARHWDIARLEGGEAPDIPDERKIYTYCQAGGRAGRAVTMLQELGYKDVVSIGGLNDWRAAGGDIIE